MSTAILWIDTLRPTGKLVAVVIDDADLVVISDDDFLRAIAVDVVGIEMIRESVADKGVAENSHVFRPALMKARVNYQPRTLVDRCTVGKYERYVDYVAVCGSACRIPGSQNAVMNGLITVIGHHDCRVANPGVAIHAKDTDAVTGEVGSGAGAANRYQAATSRDIEFKWRWIGDHQTVENHR